MSENNFSVKKKYLDKELENMGKYFFSQLKGITAQPSYKYHKDLFWLQLINFPLPKHFIDENDWKRPYSPRKANFVIIIDEYPNNGPFGIFIRKDSLNHDNFVDALKGHLYSKSVKKPPNVSKKDMSQFYQQGWKWLCFHYKKDWSFNRNNILKGDCLLKYIDNLYLALKGVL